MLALAILPSPGRKRGDARADYDPVDATSDLARRAELRAFLRARRARLRPEDVGLPRLGARRRATGLRREEVAALAGLSVTWYTLLENARNDRISLEAIASVARALRLDRDEHAYLVALAHAPLASATTAVADLPEGLLAIVADLAHTPAVVWNRRRDALAWNALFGEIFEYSAARPPWERNGVWRIFRDPASKRRWPDWSGAAARATAGLKRQFSLDPPLVHELVTELRDDPVFAAAWDAGTSVRDWMSDADGEARIVTAAGTALHFRHVTLAPPDAAPYFVQFYSPADAQTRAALAQISSSRRP